ncbi:hypothetical protein K501DRAFT_237931 [Backusella circina FSU 941]|nr:hypothetical protein K501DRAFT_237931 [Backusella circina FSU 941]
MSTLYIDTPPPKYKDIVKEQIQLIPSRAKSYGKNMFPIVDWLPKYNLVWLTGDIISALTVGILIFPQAFAYATMANFPPYYGLYTVLIGTLAYPLFGTSKDISLGCSAVLSLMVGQVLGKIVNMPQFISGEWTYMDFATNLSLITGLICTLLGLLRFGFLFRFICQPAISGFMAGSGITILVNQFPKLLGIPNISTLQATYLIFIDSLKSLKHTHYDAIVGLVGLVWLYFIKYYSQILMVKYPQHKRVIFVFNTSRSIIYLVVATVISFLINHYGKFSDSPFHILGVVPAGLGHTSPPTINKSLLEELLPDIPSLVVLMIMEHGAISSSLGKVFDYRVNMSQEVLAIGLSNVFGSFIGAYPGTGTFSRTAVASKSGSRTPLTSFFVGSIVCLSIYVLTPAFEFIPYATIAAIIIHSCTDLVSGPATWKKLWDLNPVEFIIYASSFLISLFARIDISVYVPVAISIIVQIYRTSRPKCHVLGCVALDAEKYPVKEKQSFTKSTEYGDDKPSNSIFFSPIDHEILGKYTKPIESDIVCFQPQENLVFQNGSYIFEHLMDHVKKETRRGKPLAEKVGDRTWNENSYDGKSSEKPLLNSIVLDLSGVHQMDFTGLEELVAVSIAIERYSGQPLKWYIVTGDSIAVRKALLFGGFGNQRPHPDRPGMFISDLKQNGKDEGHLPGTHGCSTKVKEYYMNSTDKDDCQQVVVIEDVQDTDRNRTRISSDTEEDKRSTTDLEKNLGMDKSSDDTNSDATDIVPNLCYCNLQQSLPEDGRIASIEDRYPYFFKSLHHAAHTALKNKRKDELYINYISDISGKAEDVSEDDSI